MWFLKPGMTFLDLIIRIADILFIIFFIFPFHEFCHAWVAHKLGDDTAKNEGRMTLNPLVHFSALGAICMLLFRVGWAKPVMTNPRNFKNLRRDTILVSLAGPFSHVLAALLGGLLLNLAPLIPSSNVAIAVSMFLVNYIMTNCYLAVLNFIPLPPLDGFSIFEALIPERYLDSYYRNFFKFQIITLLLLFIGVLDYPIELFGFATYNFVIKITHIPIATFL